MKYIILYHNGGKKWVSQQQAIQISKAMDNPANKFVDIGEEAKIAISSISQILSEREYKEQYPEQEQEYSQVFREQFPQLGAGDRSQYESIDKQAMRTKKGREQLIAGLQRYIDENSDNCENAKQMLKEKKIKFGIEN